MEICHPYLSSKGGGERIVVKLAKHFDAPIYTCEYEPRNLWSDAQNLDVRVIKHVKPTAVGYRLAFGSLKLDADVVNAQGHPSQWVRLRNKPVLWFCHFPPFVKQELSDKKLIPPGLKTLEAKIIKDIEFVFCNSKFMQDALWKHYHKRAEVLNPRTDVEKFKSKKFGNYFLYHSGIHPRKRFEMAIDAIKIVRRKHPEFKLVISGFPSDRAYEQKIRKMLGKDGEVLTNVGQDKLISLYANMYGLCYSPIKEDFGIVPIEALASGKPVVAVNEGGPREIVKNGKTGFLVNNAQQMAAKMTWLIENSTQAKTMGRAARKDAEKRFSWPGFLDRFEEVYEQLAKR